MSTANELRLQLEEKEKEERISYLNNKLQEAEKIWVGKCYATHTLSRNYKNINASISKIIGVSLNLWNYRDRSKKLEEFSVKELNSARLEFQEEAISIFLNDDPHTINKCSVSIGSYYVDSNNFRPYRYEISADEYEIIKNNLNTKSHLFGEKLREQLPKWNLFICNGDASKDSNTEEYLEKIGLELVALPKEEMVFNLRWHPFLYGDKIIKTKESIKLIEIRCAEIEEQILGWSVIPDSYKVVNQDRKILGILKEVIKLLL